MSKTELATKSGLNRTTASDIVRGIKQADIEQIEDLAMALGLNFLDVLREAEQKVNAQGPS